MFSIYPTATISWSLYVFRGLSEIGKCNTGSSSEVWTALLFEFSSTSLGGLKLIFDILLKLEELCSLL